MVKIMAKNGATSDTEMGVNTRLAHIGYNPRDYHGFVNPPVVHASTVLYPDAATLVSRGQKYTYGTHGTPTSDALAKAVDTLEGSAGTVMVPSGLAAVTLPLLAFASAGDHVLIVDSVYGPTRHFADTMLKRLGVEIEYYDPHVGAGISKLIKANTSVVFTESPGSNTFEVQDIPAIAKAAKAAAEVPPSNAARAVTDAVETSKAVKSPSPVKVEAKAEKAATRPSLEDKNRPAGIARPAAVDDLKLISGVGPKNEKILHDLGIFTFAQVASWKKAERGWVDAYLNFHGRIEREDWVKQAKALAKGGVAEYIRVFGKKPV